MSLSYDAMVEALQRDYAFPRDKAEAVARQQLGIPTFAVPVVDHAALEKATEAAADTLMQQLGFEILKFSHPGKTMQTEGLADRRYYRRPRLVQRADGQFLVPPRAVWFEAKSGSGRQRPGQVLFEELVTQCGEHYVCGTVTVLVDWLVAQGIAQRAGEQLEPRW